MSYLPTLKSIFLDELSQVVDTRYTRYISIVRLALNLSYCLLRLSTGYRNIIGLSKGAEATCRLIEQRIGRLETYLAPVDVRV